MSDDIHGLAVAAYAISIQTIKYLQRRGDLNESEVAKILADAKANLEKNAGAFKTDDAVAAINVARTLLEDASTRMEKK